MADPAPQPTPPSGPMQDRRKRAASSDGYERDLAGWASGGWRARSRAAALMYSSGALLVVLSLAFSPEADVNRWALLGLAGLAAVAALFILALGPRYTIRMAQALSAVGSVLVGTAVVLGNGTFLSVVYGMLLVWVALFCAVFFRFRTSIAQIAWGAAVHAVALYPLPAQHRWTTWTITTGTCAVVMFSYRLIQHTSARLRGVLEHSGGIVLVVDPDLNIKYAGGAVDRLLGLSTSQITGKSLLPLVHPDDWTAVQGAITGVTTPSGHPSTFEIRLNRPDGTSLYTEANVENALNNSSLDGIVMTVRDVTERRLLENELLHQAFHDPLTNLPNRALFADRVEWVLSRRKNEQCSLLFIDLDNFKDINDVFGHEGGDALLTTVARRLQHSLRAEDTAARLGGDEFAILLDGISSAREAQAIAERTLQAVQEPFFVRGRKISVGASVGIAIASSSTSLGDLLREADVAMYMAKRSGKNRCHIFHHDGPHSKSDAIVLSGEE